MRARHVSCMREVGRFTKPARYDPAHRDGYRGLVLGYNSDAQAAQHAQQFLEDKFDVSVHCIKAWSLPSARDAPAIRQRWGGAVDLNGACMAQGDVADLGTLQAMFALLRERYDNRCTAFVHNAGLIAGFTSKSDYEKSPALLRSPTQLVTDPLDVQIDT